MVGNRPLFLVGKDGILLLIARDDHLDGLFHVRLGGEFPSVPDGAQRRFVDDVGKLRAGRAGGHPRDLLEVHVVGDFDLLCVYPQDGFTTLKVGQLYRHPAVKPSGTGQGGVKGFGAVGGGEDDDAGVAFKAVHFREQLVQRLLPLVIAAHGAGVPLLADGVNLVDEHDAGGFFLRLLEQVAHLARAHAHEHFHKFGAADGEERDVRLTGDGLCQHGLAGARRAYQQHALGHGSADLPVLVRIVEIVHDLLQAFLRLVHALHVVKFDAVGGLDIHPGVGTAAVEHHGIGAAGSVHQLFGHELPQSNEQHNGQHPGQQDV